MTTRKKVSAKKTSRKKVARRSNHQMASLKPDRAPLRQSEPTPDEPKPDTMASSVEVTIKPPAIKVAEFVIRGTAPLVQHRFYRKADIMAQHKEGERAKGRKKRKPRDFDDEFVRSQHVSTEGWHGIPASAFRCALISACRVAGYVMTRAKLSLFIVADGLSDDGYPLVKLRGKAKPKKHTAYTRNETGVIDIRSRAMFTTWECTLKIRYDSDMLSVDDVANLLMRAGIQVGIGEGRPDSRKSAGMGWGTFEIVQ